MTSPSYQQRFAQNYLKQVFWAQETTTAGTSPAASSATWWTEPCFEVNATHNLVYFNDMSYYGTPLGPIDSRLVNYHALPSLVLPWRSQGLATYATAAILGDVDNSGAADVKTGAGAPWTHTMTPGLKGTRCPTFSLALDTGARGTAGARDSTHVYTYGTVNSVSYAWQLGQPVRVTVPFTSMMPGAYATALLSNDAYVSQSAPSAAVGVTPTTYAMSSGVTANLYSGSAAAYYTAQIQSGTITISRTVTPFFSTSVSRKNPYDIFPGLFTVSCQVQMLFDSAKSGSAFYDYATDNKVGTSATAGTFNQIIIQISANESIEFDFWPSKWTDLQIGDGDNARVVSGTLTAYQDTATALQASPAATILQNVIVKSALSPGLYVI